MKISYTTQFKKDYKRIQKQNKDTDKLKVVIQKLANNENLGAKYRDHQLTGDWKGHRDCHIGPDWLLIYHISETDLVLERTGSHSELFR